MHGAKVMIMPMRPKTGLVLSRRASLLTVAASMLVVAVAFAQSRTEQPDADDAIEEIHPERIRELGALDVPAPYLLMMQQWYDLDGDGRKELIVPERHSIHIVSADGTSAEVIRLSGMDAESVAPVVTEEGRHWFVAHAQHTLTPPFEVTCHAGCFSNDGTLLWRASVHCPGSQIGATVTTAAGDLDGDGRPELILGLHLYGMSRAALARDTHGYITIFDLEGHVLARRRTERGVRFLAVMEPEGPGKRRTLLAGAKVLRRYAFEAPIPAAAQEEP